MSRRTTDLFAYALIIFAGLTGVSLAVALPTIMALAVSRKVRTRPARTKCLYLTEQIEVPIGKPFTLTLRRTDVGLFEVVQRDD